jgi:hypothetical protein
MAGLDKSLNKHTFLSTTSLAILHGSQSRLRDEPFSFTQDKTYSLLDDNKLIPATGLCISWTKVPNEKKILPTVERVYVVHHRNTFAGWEQVSK